MRPWKRIIGAAAALVLAVQPSCSGEATGVRPVATLIQVVEGGGQPAVPVGTVVPISPAVRVIDQHGEPMPRVLVTFAVGEGGGTVTGGSVRTDPDGVARAGTWTIGPQMVRNTLDVTVAGLQPHSIAIMARSGPPASVELISGDLQTATVGTVAPTPMQVRLRDAFGNLAEGHTVGFSVTAGGGTLASSSGVSNAQGIATGPEWTLGRAVGQLNNVVTVTVQGLEPLQMRASATVGAPAILEVRSAMPATDTVGSPVSPLPQVRVTDQYGNPIAGHAVTFAVTEGMGTITGGTVATDVDGVATVGSWTLGTVANVANRLVASAGSLTPVMFQTLSQPDVPANIVRLAGNAQTQEAGFGVLTRPSVIVSDRFGNIVPGTPVQFAAVQGGGSVVGGTQFTNMNGEAAVLGWTIGVGANQLRATATAGNVSTLFSATGIVTSRINGYVMSAVSNYPIAMAEVSLGLADGTVRKDTTDNNGYFELRGLATGSYNVTATADGYIGASSSGVNVVTTATEIDTVGVDFALAPNGNTKQFAGFSGRVLDGQGNAIPNAAVTLSGGAQTNGVFRSTVSDGSGNYAFSGVNLIDVNGQPITTFTVRAFATGFGMSSRTVTMTRDQITPNVNITLGPVGNANVFYADAFETPAAWTATGLWNRWTYTGLRNDGVADTIKPYVRLAPNDTTQGRLPRAASGSYAWWFGSPVTGNFIGQRTVGDAIWSGGTSEDELHGTLTSPVITVPSGVASVALRFDTWFEIESVNPNADGFDIMEVLLRDEATGDTVSLGRLNPWEDPPMNENWIPFTSAGFNRMPVWRPVLIDATQMSGKSVRVIFSFRTVDALYNGFRGWMVDNVTVTNEAAMLLRAPTALPPLTLQKVANPNARPLPRKQK